MGKYQDITRTMKKAPTSKYKEQKANVILHSQPINGFQTLRLQRIYSIHCTNQQNSMHLWSDTVTVVN